MTLNIDNQLLEYLLKLFSNSSAIEKAVLFGSRARSDHRERSDYDIALFGSIDSKTKHLLQDAIEWETPTLHKIDLIFFNDYHDEKFKQNILKEGILFYDKNRK